VKTSGVKVEKTRVIAFRPSHIKNFGIGYAATVLSIGMNSDLIDADIYSLSSTFFGTDPHVKRISHPLIVKILDKVLSKKRFHAVIEAIFFQKAKHYDVAYLWPGCSTNLIKKLRALGKVIILEAVNSHRRYSKELLDRESDNLGGIQTHIITEQKIRNEDERLGLCDFVFSPSNEVTKSLIASQIAEKKIINVSYGLMKQELFPTGHLLGKSNDTFTAIFVGSGIVRKGIHLLLDAWRASNVKGKLKVIGGIDFHAEQLVENYKNDDSIEFISFAMDLNEHYKSADVFLLPSIEEGSPLVTYLAMGAGLPCVVSPMGSGGVVRNEIDGFVIPEHDKEKWIEAIQVLAEDLELRNKMAVNIRNNAENYLWDKVAMNRGELLIKYLRDL
jgi:glycosyltransferase involved in cell wall biosynthesis